MKLILIIAAFFVVISEIQVIHAEQVGSKYDDLVMIYQDRVKSSGIQPEDSIYDVILKLSMDNLSAIAVLIKYKNSVNEIEQKIPHPIILMLMFDSLGITGSKIWILYKVVCHENIVCMHACMHVLDQCNLEYYRKANSILP